MCTSGPWPHCTASLKSNSLSLAKSSSTLRVLRATDVLPREHWTATRQDYRRQAVVRRTVSDRGWDEETEHVHRQRCPSVRGWKPEIAMPATPLRAIRTDGVALRPADRRPMSPSHGPLWRQPLERTDAPERLLARPYSPTVGGCSSSRRSTTGRSARIERTWMSLCGNAISMWALRKALSIA